MQSVFTGPVYVVRDNIDTDQIIPAQYLTLVPTIPDEYEKLGSYALCGLPDALYPTRFVKEGLLDTDFPIVVAGKNFGCGSSREHAPIAIKACGIGGIVAKSFGRIFYRNAINLGLAVVECPDAIGHAKAGADAGIDFATSTLTVGGRTFTIPQYPHEVLEILRVGGLVPFMRARLDQPAKAAAH